jgi:hypothetical protein
MLIDITRVWESNNLHEVIERLKASPRLSVFCSSSKQKVFTVYLDMLEEFLMPVLKEDGPDSMLLQQYGPPPHFHKEMTDFLNSMFSEKWIYRDGAIAWPSRSLDLIPLDPFYTRGYIKVAVQAHHCLPICRNFLGK